MLETKVLNIDGEDFTVDFYKTLEKGFIIDSIFDEFGCDVTLLADKEFNDKVYDKLEND